MRYDVLFYWNHLQQYDLTRRLVVVADVLRATTVMSHALYNGAEAVIPQENDEQARAQYHQLLQQNVPTLLCGEKDGFKRPGYDLGNSPWEFIDKTAQGKTLVHLTTNGTQALRAASAAQRVYIASFANLSAVTERLEREASEAEQVLFVVSGREGRYCLEDTVCLGGVLAQLIGPPGGAIAITDAGRTAIDLYQLYRGDLLSMLRQCYHGRYLIEIGLQEDLPICAQVDSAPCAPVMENGRIHL